MRRTITVTADEQREVSLEHDTDRPGEAVLVLSSGAVTLDRATAEAVRDLLAQFLDTDQALDRWSSAG